MYSRICIYWKNSWFKNLSTAEIQLLEQIYTLKLLKIKRKLIYENNKLISTKPYIINNDKKLFKFLGFISTNFLVYLEYFYIK